jgi:DNA-binding beta-propeller fold protein YncE
MKKARPHVSDFKEKDPAQVDWLVGGAWQSLKRLGPPIAVVALCALTASCSRVLLMDAAARRGEPSARPLVFAAGAPVREVVFVGNNWDGTATVFDPVTFDISATIDVAPDRDARWADINRSVIRRAAAKGIRSKAGEGHDQLVDDMFSSKDGRYLFVSRPSFADVVALDLVDNAKIVWRASMDGFRADHAALSPDGTTLLVSDSTARRVHAIDTSTGEKLKYFESGDEPHESNFSPDGGRIYHASIGRVFIHFSRPWLNWTKGRRLFEVDARDLHVIDTVDMGRKMKEFGKPWIDNAVRPMTVTKDGRWLYFQLSFLHGFVEYDLGQNKVTRLADLPVPPDVRKMPLRNYQLNSAHHGITLNGEDTKLCVAATMSRYAGIVDRATFRTTTIPVGDKPYWATTSRDGQSCYVSVSGENRVSVISFAEERQIRTIAVGAHPQRIRIGTIRVDAPLLRR